MDFEGGYHHLIICDYLNLHPPNEIIQQVLELALYVSSSVYIWWCETNVHVRQRFDCYGNISLNAESQTHQLTALSIKELCRIRDDELVTDLNCNEINIILNELCVN